MGNMKNFIVDLDPPDDRVEQYEEKDANVLMVRVQLPTGEMVGGSNYRVEITLSKDAMIGLGTALIRSACLADDETNLFWHLHPSIPELISQQLGVFLHPKSCELLMSENDFESVHKIVSEAYKNN